LTALYSGLLLMIDARTFREIFDRWPEGLLEIVRLASERLRRTTEQLMDIRALSGQARLAKALVSLATMRSSGSTGLPLHLSQSELGAMAGVCREMVNKYLSLWRDAGWIDMAAGRVTSVDSTAISTVPAHENCGNDQ
jgi:CRP/FNR family transcriptional regulator, cyclic AMP receptor protein